jgi:hypothetical protein
MDEGNMGRCNGETINEFGEETIEASSYYVHTIHIQHLFTRNNHKKKKDTLVVLLEMVINYVIDTKNILRSTS